MDVTFPFASEKPKRNSKKEINITSMIKVSMAEDTQTRLLLVLGGFFQQTNARRAKETFFGRRMIGRTLEAY